MTLVTDCDLLLEKQQDYCWVCALGISHTGAELMYQCQHTDASYATSAFMQMDNCIQQPGEEPPVRATISCVRHAAAHEHVQLTSKTRPS